MCFFIPHVTSQWVVMSRLENHYPTAFRQQQLGDSFSSVRLTLYSLSLINDNMGTSVQCQGATMWPSIFITSQVLLYHKTGQVENLCVIPVPAVPQGKAPREAGRGRLSCRTASLAGSGSPPGTTICTWPAPSPASVRGQGPNVLVVRSADRSWRVAVGHKCNSSQMSTAGPSQRILKVVLACDFYFHFCRHLLTHAHTLFLGWAVLWPSLDQSISDVPPAPARYCW